MSFSSILPPAGGNNDFDIFSVEAADELGPIPGGRYVTIAERGGPKAAKTGTRGYEIQFRVIEGEFTGRKVWKFFASTVKAAPLSRRDLAKFGITTREQLARDLPAERFVVELVVTIRTDERTGISANDVKGIKVVRIETPKADPFAPPAASPAEVQGQRGEGGGGLFRPDGQADGLGGLRR